MGVNLMAINFLKYYPSPRNDESHSVVVSLFHHGQSGVGKSKV